MTIKCFDCNKKMDARDVFNTNPTELVNPLSLEIAPINKDLCLKCYMQRRLHSQTICVNIKN